MKTKLIIALLLITIGIQAQVRPPIQTNELRTNKLEWRTLPMGRDSLNYWFPINNNSFTLARPDGSYSKTYSFSGDSIYWSIENLWVCEGCQIFYNDSLFTVRRDPACSNCWQYSYDGVYWRDLFCETNLDRILEVVPSAENVLDLGDYLTLPDEDNLRAGVTYIGFDRDSANEGKTLKFVNDTARWVEVLPDSAYYGEEWHPFPDTIPTVYTTITINDVSLTNGDSIYVDPSSTNELDSIQINGVWYANGDTYTPIDNSVTNEKDSIYFENLGIWVGGGESTDLFWKPGGNYYGIKYEEDISSVGIGTDAIWQAGLIINRPYQLNPTWWGILVIDTISDISTAIEGRAKNGDGVLGIAYGGGDGVIGSSMGGGEGVTGFSATGWAGYFHSNGAGLGVYIEDSLKVGTGTTIARSGSIAEKDFWTGTQAEYDALTPAATTIYFIHNGYGWFGLLMLIFLTIGSKAQNWTAVKVGSTDINLIMQGTDTIWMKPSTCTGVVIAGECYDTIRIDTQTWLARNLHYDDSGGGIYSYDNNTANSDVYGYLYTWDAANRVDALVSGWHLPSDSEYGALATYLSTNVGGKLKEADTTHWLTPNSGATNETGFTGLPGGSRNSAGPYSNITRFGIFWTATKPNVSNAYYRYLYYNDANLTRDQVVTSTGFSVRLIKDQP